MLEDLIEKHGRKLRIERESGKGKDFRFLYSWQFLKL